MKPDLKLSRPLVGRQPSFRTDRQSPASYRILVVVFLILVGAFLLAQNQRGAVQPLFLPTPTPTRTADSYLLEAGAHFDAGRIDDPLSFDAIEAYRQALQIAPQNAAARAELARILTYSSSLLSTVEQRRARLVEARQEIDQAVALSAEDSTIHAVRALVYDWSANLSISGEASEDYLAEARQAAARALQLDPNNALALAFYAEVLVDQQEWTQAEQYVKQAVALDPNAMDTHRVHGYVLESLGLYNAAIEEYLRAAEINPNLTFLYIAIGLNYRSLRVYNRALEYFAKAASINDALGVQDPIPYIEIAKTYAQQGEFFIASRNAEKALSFDPQNANTYGQLGSIYVQARNYEGALPVLKCAVEGCTAAENEAGEVDVQGLSLSTLTVAYYYLRYASVLAALDICAQALPVLDQVGAAYPDDPVIQSILQENYLICGR
jgi:tetratricopeptide (TPR) repeat protein